MAADPLGYRSLFRILRCAVVLLLGFPGCWRWPPVGEAVTMATCRYSEEQKEVSSARTFGNATLIGLFNLQSNRRDCDPSARPADQVRPVNAAETQRMLAAVWALEWLNERDILGGGMTVGFAGYSACTDTKTALRRTIYGLSQMGTLDRCHDNETANMLLGYIGPTDYSNSEVVSGLLNSLNVTHQQLRLNNLESEIKAITSVLNRLEWDQVTLITENSGLRDQFFEISAREGICISQSFVLTRDANYTSIYPSLKQTGSQVVVFLGFDYQLLKALEESTRYPELSDLYWLVAGPTVYPGFKLSRVSDNPVKHHKIYFAQSAVTKVPGFEDYLTSFPDSVELDDDVRAFVNDCFKEKSKQLEIASIFGGGGSGSGGGGGLGREGTTGEEISSGCAPILNNDVIAVAESVAKLTERFRSSRNGCPSSSSSSGVEGSPARANETGDCETFGDYLFQVPQLLSDQLNVSVMAYQVGPQNNMRFIEVGLYYNNQLIMKAEDMGILHDVGGGWFKVPRFRCPSCPCLNNPDKSGSALGDFWRVEPWVAVCSTLASIGTLVAIVVLVFIVVRICRGDAMEGSQAFAFLILVGIVLAYGAIIPFMLSASPIVCNIRPIGIGLAYALIFAPILARSLMLATSDPDGLLGHVSGLVQTSLFFFMIAVQLALGVQQWWLVSGPEANPLSIRYDGVGCIVSTVDYTLALSYVSLLLVLLLILTPFCIRNRRNYHEGLFFFLATLASLAVWVAWVAVFFKLDAVWKQPILCLGLVSTASVILIIVFIPRVFKMVRAITLDTTNAGGQSVGRCTVPSVTDVATRGSNAMIYETVNHAYAPEPILVNGDGVVVKSPSRINVSANPAASVGIVVEDSSIIVPMASAETIEEEDTDETKETTGPTIAEEMEKVKAIDDSSPEKEENGSTNGVAQRKPPTVTHL